jgi:NAD(P)-dependent dehydrogenase (short-subunit alcohol dehydrogenase family)
VARVFVTGSSQGLGLMATERLAAQGHEVVLHARDAGRAEAARRALPAAASVLVADVSTIAAMRSLADQANALGRFDAVIHNVAVGYREKRRVVTADGLSQLWAVNVLAPYVLTALMERPARLVYLSSELHRRVDGDLDDLQWERRPWHGTRAYSDTKFQDAVLAMAVARLWPGCGPMCCRTRSSPAGCRPAWAVRAPAAISSPAPRRRLGSRSATTRRRGGRVGTSSTSARLECIPQRAEARCRTGLSPAVPG